MFFRAFAIALIIGLIVQTIISCWHQIDINGNLKWFQSNLHVPCFSLEYYHGKRIIVTGASKGIGRQLAIQASQLGAK